jgi:hypothetical protein
MPVYQYQFTSTIKDLLDAEDADATERSVRKSLRWAIAVIGAAAVVTAVEEFILMGLSIQPVMRLLLGGYAVYYFAVARYWKRREIRRQNASSLDVAFEFRDTYLEIRASENGTYKREWNELLDVKLAARSVLLYFADGTVNWLPNRVFRDKAEKMELVQFLRSRGEE